MLPNFVEIGHSVAVAEMSQFFTFFLAKHSLAKIVVNTAFLCQS